MIYTSCTSIIHLSENTFCFLAWLENILLFILWGKPVWLSDLKTWFCGEYQSEQLFTSNEKYLLLDIRLLWFWNPGMVNACLYILFMSLYILLFTLYTYFPDQFSHCNSTFNSLTFKLINMANTNDIPSIHIMSLYILLFTLYTYFSDQRSHCNLTLSSLTFSLVSTTSTNDIPIIQFKRVMDCAWLHVSIT